MPLKVGDFARVKPTAPDRVGKIICDAKERERVRIFGVVEPNDPNRGTWDEFPPGERIYCCDFWDEDGESWTCFWAEADLEPLQP